jgi:hypothetical protein
MKLIKSTPGELDPAVKALHATMAATSAAIENMTQAARQATELADAGVKVVTEAAAKA